MDAFSATLLVMFAWVAVLIAVRPALERMREAWRAAPRGPVTEAERLEERAQPIGRYAGREIYASVTFRGQRYHFAGICPAPGREGGQPRELLVEPGLLYRVDN